MTLWTEDFAVLGVISQLRELGERFDMMNVKPDNNPAAFAHATMLDAALLALVAGTLKGFFSPLSRLPASPRPAVDFRQATLPVRILLANQAQVDLRLPDVRLVRIRENPPRLEAMVLVRVQFDSVLLEPLVNDRLTDTKVFCDFSHRHLLVQRLENILGRVKRPAPATLHGRDAMFVQALADCFSVDAVHLADPRAGIELVELL